MRGDGTAANISLPLKSGGGASKSTELGATLPYPSWPDREAQASPRTDCMHLAEDTGEEREPPSGWHCTAPCNDKLGRKQQQM